MDKEFGLMLEALRKDHDKLRKEHDDFIEDFRMRTGEFDNRLVKVERRGGEVDNRLVKIVSDIRENREELIKVTEGFIYLVKNNTDQHEEIKEDGRLNANKIETRIDVLTDVITDARILHETDNKTGDYWRKITKWVIGLSLTILAGWVSIKGFGKEIIEYFKDFR